MELLSPSTQMHGFEQFLTYAHEIVLRAGCYKFGRPSSNNIVFITDRSAPGTYGKLWKLQNLVILLVFVVVVTWVC